MVLSLLKEEIADLFDAKRLAGGVIDSAWGSKVYVLHAVFANSLGASFKAFSTNVLIHLTGNCLGVGIVKPGVH